MRSSAVSDLAGRLRGLTLRHATGILLYGPEGAGKRVLAEGLAKALLCPRAEDGDACDDCPVCRAFDAGRAVDLLLVLPRGKGGQIKVRAVTGGRGKDESEDEEDDDAPGVPPSPVLQFLRTPPLMARHKVVIIDPAERMNQQASNALLKTLEEPPAHARIILVTNELSRVMSTVRSRCVGVPVAVDRPEAEGAQTRAETLFGRTPGGIQRVRAHAEAYEGLLAVMDSVRAAPRGAALRLAEDFRHATEQLAKATRLSPRAAQAEGLRCLSEWVIAERPDRAPGVAEAHRLIMGNVGAPGLFDALFAGLVD